MNARSAVQTRPATATSQAQASLSASVRTIGRYVLALVYVGFVLAPLLYMLSVALHDAATAGAGPILPHPVHWQTFREMWSTIPLLTYIKNSLLIAICAGAIAAILGMGCGYVVGRFRFRFREPFRIALLATYLTPGVLVLLPLYVIYVVIQRTLHVTLIGGYGIVIITYLTFALPFAIWMSSVYIASLPAELEEAALVDGATRLQALRYVVLPLALPGLVVAFIFSFLHAWNDVLFASVLTSPATRTLAVGLQYYAAQNYAFPLWNQLMGASLVSAIPAVVLFFFVQRYIVQGLAAGSLKG
ncbi:MAG: carbohydrate ABC transporter permease [Thermorudis peleae]|nr:carbohydrate ABC transporter permease [Thermorudis peleae]